MDEARETDRRAANRTDADAPRSVRDPSGLSGRQVSHFRILEPLGAGGMGVVYRAEDLRLHRTVALKFMRPDYTLDDTATARFLREARSVAALDHPNICTIHEVGETEDGQLFLAMSHYPGETLRDRLTKRGPLAPYEALDIAAQIARGLAAAHGAGIIHRDLKPANVMLTADGTVKILDFGLAKARDQTMTATGAVMGTVAYMSPEQLVGDPVDARSDLWSLGVVLFEMLTGTHPSRNDDSTATLTQHLEVRRAASLHPDSTNGLLALVRRLLKKDPDERYQSARDVLPDIVALHTGLPLPVGPAVGSAHLTRRRVTMAVLAALILAAGVFGTVRWRQSAQAPTPQVSVAVLPLRNLSGADQAHIAAGVTDELTTTLSKIAGLRVIAHQSMLQFKGSSQSVPEIARRMKVAYVVDGSVQHQDGRVRVRASLIDASSNTPKWVSPDFDRQLRDLMALQQEVALAIAREVEVVLTPRDRARLPVARTLDPEALRLYSYGTQARHDANFSGDFTRAAGYLRQAIAKDSAYAEAYAGLALIHAFNGAPDSALHYAERAIGLEPKLADGYMVRGLVRQHFEWKWQGAERDYREAIALTPGHAEAHHELSMLLLRLGRFDEAEQEGQAAVYYAPTSTRFIHGIGEVYLFARRYDDARGIADTLLAQDSTFSGAYQLRALANMHAGRYEAAEADWRECIRLAPAACGFGRGDVAYLLAKTNRRADALKIVDTLEAEWREDDRRIATPGLSMSLASAYIGLGDTAQALTWLERGVEGGQFLLYTGVDPGYDPLRRHPRFIKVLERLGLHPPPSGGVGR
jgi:serine/threonine-protein kinase